MSPVAETEIALICEAEVKNLDHAVGADFDVRGFEITMNDALFMRGFEGLGDLARDGQGLGDGAPRAM